MISSVKNEGIVKGSENLGGLILLVRILCELVKRVLSFEILDWLVGTFSRISVVHVLESNTEEKE